MQVHITSLILHKKPLNNIVHRTSSADHILILGNSGEIVEQGTFAELSCAGGYLETLTSTTERRLAGPQHQTITETNTSSLLSPLHNAPTRQKDNWATYAYLLSMIGRWNAVVFLLFCMGFVFCLSFPRKLISICSPWCYDINESQRSGLAGGPPQMKNIRTSDLGITLAYTLCFLSLLSYLLCLLLGRCLWLGIKCSFTDPKLLQAFTGAHRPTILDKITYGSSRNCS